MDSDEHSKAKDEVYRRIGRNMLLFQQVEQMLKALLNNARIAGTVDEIEKLLEQRKTSPDKRMLGELIKPLIENHLTPVDVPPPPATGQEISCSFNFTFEHTAEERTDLKKQLEAMVAERNEFVHHLLPKLRLDSTEGCRAASDALEQQRERVLPVRNKLRELVGTLIVGRANFAEYILKNLEMI
jgi:hypothetical protein